MAFENEGVLKSKIKVCQEEKEVVPKKYRVTFIMLVSCFILWGLLNNMTDNLVPAFGKIFMMSAVDSSLVQFAFYGSYAVLAIPAAIIIKKYTFRHGVLIGLGFYIIGALGYIPATIHYQNKDEECDLDIVPNEGRNVEVKYAMSNSLGFGGHNGSIIFKKYED